MVLILGNINFQNLPTKGRLRVFEAPGSEIWAPNFHKKLQGKIEENRGSKSEVWFKNTINRMPSQSF
jgi:hypothetical protein